MIPSDFFFLRPTAAYLLLALPLFLLLFWRLFHYRENMLKILPKTLTPRSKAIYWSKCAALMAAWTGITFSLMSPQGNAYYERLPEQKTQRVVQELILLVDSSASMNVSDSRNEMSRLDYAKDIAEQLVSDLKGESVSLYAFTSEVTPLSPTTMDYLFVRLTIRQMQINEGDTAGTSLVNALQTLHQKMLELPAQRMKRLLLMSDGGDTTLERVSAEEKEKAIASLLDLFADIPHLRIDAVGMGSHKGGVVPDVTDSGHPVYSALDEELLRRLARRYGGQYIEANSSTTPAIAKALLAQKEEAKPTFEEGVSRGQKVHYESYFQIPLGISLLLLIFVLGWPDTRKRT